MTNESQRAVHQQQRTSTTKVLLVFLDSFSFSYVYTVAIRSNVRNVFLSSSLNMPYNETPLFFSLTAQVHGYPFYMGHISGICICMTWLPKYLNIQIHEYIYLDNNFDYHRSSFFSLCRMRKHVKRSL